eukprot:1618793-Pleurochrysis_carterae.AAC.5
MAYSVACARVRFPLSGERASSLCSLSPRARAHASEVAIRTAPHASHEQSWLAFPSLTEVPSTWLCLSWCTLARRGG